MIRRDEIKRDEIKVLGFINKQGQIQSCLASLQCFLCPILFIAERFFYTGSYDPLVV